MAGPATNHKATQITARMNPVQERVLHRRSSAPAPAADELWKQHERDGLRENRDRIGDLARNRVVTHLFAAGDCAQDEDVQAKHDEARQRREIGAHGVAERHPEHIGPESQRPGGLPSQQDEDHRSHDAPSDDAGRKKTGRPCVQPACEQHEREDKDGPRNLHGVERAELIEPDEQIASEQVEQNQGRQGDREPERCVTGCTPSDACER